MHRHSGRLQRFSDAMAAMKASYQRKISTLKTALEEQQRPQRRRSAHAGGEALKKHIEFLETSVSWMHACRDAKADGTCRPTAVGYV